MKPASFFLLLALAVPLGTPLSGIAGLVVSGGEMQVAGGFLVTSGQVGRVQSGAQMKLEDGSTIRAALLHIQNNGVVRGCGTIEAAVQNEGDLVADCGTGTSLVLIGGVTNQAAVRVRAGTALETGSHPFVNEGLLDTMTAAGALPSGLTGGGAVYTTQSAPPLEIEVNNATASFSFLALALHQYELQQASVLQPADWVSIGGPLTGLDQVLQVPHSIGATTNRTYFRYRILPE